MIHLGTLAVLSAVFVVGFALGCACGRMALASELGGVFTIPLPPKPERDIVEKPN